MSCTLVHPIVQSSRKQSFSSHVFGIIVLNIVFYLAPAPAIVDVAAEAEDAVAVVVVDLRCIRPCQVAIRNPSKRQSPEVDPEDRVEEADHRYEADL